MTLDFLDIWEMDNNDEYYYLGFQKILEDKKMQETFRLTPRQWVRKTRAIGIVCEKGHTGDIYAHPTIACDFAAWLFPEVKIKLFESVKLGEDFFKEI